MSQNFKIAWFSNILKWYLSWKGQNWQINRITLKLILEDSNWTCFPSPPPPYFSYIQRPKGQGNKGKLISCISM